MLSIHSKQFVIHLSRIPERYIKYMLQNLLLSASCLISSEKRKTFCSLYDVPRVIFNQHNMRNSGLGGDHFYDFRVNYFISKDK